MKIDDNSSKFQTGLASKFCANVQLSVFYQIKLFSSLTSPKAMSGPKIQLVLSGFALMLGVRANDNLNSQFVTKENAP